MLKGIPVQLAIQSTIGKDLYGAPIKEEKWVTIENVLVGEPSAKEITDQFNLNGKYISYVLGIPKSDKHDWKDTKVRFFEKTFKTFGAISEGIDSMIPLEWNKKVKVELYE